jgi:hypothetical protein
MQLSNFLNIYCAAVATAQQVPLTRALNGLSKNDGMGLLFRAVHYLPMVSGTNFRRNLKFTCVVLLYLHTACILHAYCMHTACILPTYCLHIACILPAYCLHTACILPAYCLHTACILPAYSLHTPCILPASQDHKTVFIRSTTSTARILHVSCLYTASTACILQCKLLIYC